MTFFQTIKGFFVSKQFKRFIWTAIDSFLGLLIVYFTEINLLWAIPIIAAIQLITKEAMNKIGRVIAGRKK